MFYVWLGIVILLALAEVISVNLTTIWFVISGLVSLGISFMTDNFMIQFGVFVILGIILLVTTKSKLQELILSHNSKTNLDRILDMTGIVTEKITEKKNGAVKVDGKVWTAYSDSTIKVDEEVKILKIDSTKLKVEKIKE